jgi:hypothetical protein
MKLIEVKVLEKAKLPPDGGVPRLEGYLYYPDRYRYVNCWCFDGGGIQIVGAEGKFDFIDGYCADFAGMGEAWIQGEILAARYMEGDRFVAVIR